jgi:O-antigen/teichoic acid export membrane protein
MSRKKIIKDTSWNIVDYISTLAIFLITTKILIEQIGTDGYGFYMFFTSLIGTFGLVDLGMGMAVSKYLSEFLHHQKYDEANQVITIAFMFYSIIGLSLFLIVLFFNSNIIDFLNFDEKFFSIGATVLVLTSIIFIVNMISTIMINTLVALEEWKKISLINIVMKILNAIVLVYILTLEISLYEKISYIFYLLLGFALLKGMIYFIYSKKSFTLLTFRVPSKEVKYKMMKFLKVSSLQYGLSLLGGHLDKFIISKFFGLEALGIYSFVVNAFVYLYGFLTNIFKIFLPKLSKLHGDKDLEALKSNFKSLLVYSLLSSIVLALGAIAIWKPFIGVYIDSEFAKKSFNYLLVFALFLVVRSAEPIFAYFFNAIAKPSVLVVNLVIGSITTIVGYLMFVPLIDIYGLVTSQIIASIVVYGYNFIMIKKRGFNEFTK